MTNNPFRYFAGVFRKEDILSLAPANAEFDDKSSLKYGDLTKVRGKAPAIKWRSGKYGGYSWRTHQSTDDDFDEWAAEGNNVGLRLTANDLVIDIDSSKPERTKAIEEATLARLGKSPLRVGGRGGMLFYRTEKLLDICSIQFAEGAETEKVEVFTAGRQVALYGGHPTAKSGEYKWPRQPKQGEPLSLVTQEMFDLWVADMRALLPEAQRISTSKAPDRREVNQEALRVKPGKLDLLRRVVRLMPNTPELFPDRDSYVAFGYACKGAFPDEREAYEAWTDWADRYTKGSKPEVWAKDWRGIKPPFEVGADRIFNRAIDLGIISRAEVHFEEPEDSEPPAVDGLFPDEPPSDADVFPLLSLDEIVSRPPPAMLIARHIPAVSLGFLYSVPGAGKSFIAQDIGLHISSELTEWHGDGIKADPEAVVLYIAAEGSYGLRNRVRAWAKQHNRPTLPERFLVIEQTIDFMRLEDIDKLMRTVRAAARGRPCLIVVDTVSRAMPGADENLQKEMTLFVRACDRLRDAFKCAVLGVHHAGKNGDMRGSTVLLGAGDFVFRLERQAGRTIGHLHCEKQKDAADGWSEPYAFNLVPLEDGETSLVVSRAALGVGPVAELTPALAGEVLAAMRGAWVAGEPWAKTYHAKDRWAVKQMAKRFGFEPAAAEELLGVWEGSGMIVDEVVSPKSKLRGFRVVADASGGQVGASVFD